MGEMSFDILVDVRGMLCPLPLLKTKQALGNIRSGQTLKVIASDPQTKITFPTYLARSGDTMLAVEEYGGEMHYYIKKQ